jgi:hypothetical protein
MTDNVRGSLGPPWSVDLLADLHAGVLDQAESERLWPQVNADPDARAVLEALDSVKVDLGHLGTAPAEPMPAQFAAKLDAALAAEARTRWPQSPVAIPQQTAAPAQQPAPVTDLAAARKRRNRMAGWGVGVLTAAAAAAAITFVALPDNTTSGTPDSANGSQNSEQSAQPPLALSSDNLNNAIGLLNGKKDYGPLKDEQGLRACLDQNEIPAADVVGVSPVTFDGQQAVGALFGAGEPGQPGRFRLVVVTEDCEPLADSPLPS